MRNERRPHKTNIVSAFLLYLPAPDDIMRTIIGAATRGNAAARTALTVARASIMVVVVVVLLVSVVGCVILLSECG